MHAQVARLLVCTPLVVLAVLPARQSAGSDQMTVVSFDEAERGALPDTFRAISSSDEEPGRWQVQRMGGRQVLSQIDLGGSGYRLAGPKDLQIEHLRAGVRLQVGKGDEAGGLAWRVRDARNYYAARLDINDHELVVYKFVDGNRIRLSRLERLRLDRDQWHEILVEHVGERLRVWLNGIPVASERDNSLHSPGMLAFWLPGDSTAHFERLWYEPVERE